MSRSNLVGRWFIKRTRPAIIEAKTLFPKARDYFGLRAQVLKLAFWPKAQQHNAELLVDLNWSKIYGIDDVYELRVNDIGGQRTIRVIFFVTDTRLEGDPDMKRIWILCVMAKKKPKFSNADIELFRCRRQLVIERFYSDAPVEPKGRTTSKGKKRKRGK